MVRTLLRGEASALADHCRQLRISSDVLDFGPGTASRCWGSIRHLLAQLRQYCGDLAFDSILKRHLPAAGQIPGVVPPGLEIPQADQELGEKLCAAVESHLSHNILVQSPMFEAWAALLAELLAQTEHILLVEDLARVDRESLAALRALYRRFPQTAPPLVAGYDPNQEADAPDADGLLWQNPAEDIHTLALAFIALPDSRVVDLTRADDQKPLPQAPEASDPRVAESSTALRGADDEAWDLLGSIPKDSELPADDLRRVLETVESCFRCFSFTSTLRLGLELLSRSPELTPDQTARLHGTVALAAHNRQFRSRGNRDLARFLEAHLTQALEAETLPARRSCLCYRLAVTLGRRQKDFEAGLKWADRAIEEATQTTDFSALQRAHLEAWGRNIRAYIYLGLKRPGDAQIDCQRAFELVDGAIESPLSALQSADPMVQEAGFTHSLLADNLAALAKFSDDADGFAHWKEIADEIARAAPGLVRFEAILWVELYRGLLRYDLAASKAKQGLEASRLEEDPLREFNYAVQLADLLDRQGQCDLAGEAFEIALSIRDRLGRPRFLRPVEVYAGQSFLRGGPTERAHELFQQRLDQLDPEDSGARAQVLARLGYLASTLDDGDGSERQINRAIDLAVECGNRAILLDVAVLAGRSCQALGRDDDARAAYLQASELAREASDSPSLAAQSLALNLGLAELDANSDRVLEALRLWPTALADSEAWWDLPRLCGLIESHYQQLANHLEAPDLSRPLSQLRQAAEMRSDCTLLTPDRGD